MKKIIFTIITLLSTSGLYAVTAIAHYGVILNPNGGENRANVSCIVADQGNSILVPNPTRAGFSFAGWDSSNESYKNLILPVIPDKAIDEEIVFDGASTYYDLGRDYMYTDAITVNLWAYMDNWEEYATGSMRMISCTEGGGWNIEPTATTVDGYFRFVGHDGVGYKSANSNVKCSALSAGWHMFTLTFNGHNIKGYIDGKHVATGKRFSSGAISYNATNSILVGAEPGTDNVPAGTSCYFKGSISHLSISNAYLSPTGAANMYAAGRIVVKSATPYIVSADNEAQELVATWTANEATTLTLDAAGGDNTMDQSTYTLPIGTAITVTNPTRKDYEFLSWDILTSQYISNYQGIACSSPEEIVFDGSSTYYNIGRDRMYSDVITINVWAYMDNWAEYTLDKTMRIYSCTQGGGFGLEPYNDAIHFASYDSKRDGTGGYHGALSGILWSELTSGWHMFTHVFDGARVYGYLDGHLIATSADEFAGEIGYNATNSIIIGAEAHSVDITNTDPKFFKGKIKNFAIMHSAITASEVSELYNNPGTARYYFPSEDWTMTATWKPTTTTGINNIAGVQTLGYYLSDDMCHITGIDVEEIKIYNAMGQCVSHVLQKNEVSIAGLEGVYVVQIQDNTGIIYIRKIIIK